MPDVERFRNRSHAGKLLAQRLRSHAHQPGVIVLALPRGGVPVAFAVASALEVELDILLVRKLGLPSHPEYAMGAVASGGVRVLQPGLLESGRVNAAMVQSVTERELREIERRERLYRGARPPPQLSGRTAILIDDGVATGATMRAAIEITRKMQAAHVIVALPVGAPDSIAMLAPLVDELICLSTPMRFSAVSQWYDDFDQTGDDEVQDLLATAWRDQSRRAQAAHQ